MAILQENDFREREARLKKFWEDNQIYRFENQAGSPIYSVDTPPPYVSADHLHAGHILSYSQAEFIVRYKRMKGYNVLYPMGFDDNGLPTERYVEKKYNIDKSKISRHEFVKLCLEETKIGSQNYKRLWTDLGISVDWSKTYSTIDPLCQRFSQWSFIELYKKGKAYRKTEPMLWCSFCQTALAQADLEDKEVTSLQGHLLKKEPIKHVTNVHERCGTIVELIPTTQWFIEVLPIKDKLIALGRELNWYPTHMRNMYEDWVNGLEWDWCISRQRNYGVPFPIWFCKECGEIIPADTKNLPIDPTEDCPTIAACPACGGREFIPDNDVMDTWATSSCTPFTIPELIENIDLRKEIFPISLRPQAFEIIRTWIFYSMVKAYYHFGTIPFTNVMISGHGLDEHGRKISKRLGNYIQPEKLLAEYSADAIRYRATEDSAKFTMFVCLFNTLKLYAPIMPFITEELYQLLYKKYEGIISIHKTQWPEWNSNWIMDEQEYEQMKHLLEEIDAIRKEKKEKGLRYKDVLDTYRLRTEIDTTSLIEKLKIIFSIQKINPTEDNLRASM